MVDLREPWEAFGHTFTSAVSSTAIGGRPSPVPRLHGVSTSPLCILQPIKIIAAAAHCRHGTQLRPPSWDLAGRRELVARAMPTRGRTRMRPERGNSMSTATEVNAARARSWAARMAAAVLLAAAFAAIAPSGASAATVCDNATPSSYFFQTIRVRGKAIARVWMHWDASHRSCTVLRALKWKGTPPTTCTCESARGETAPTTGSAARAGTPACTSSTPDRYGTRRRGAKPFTRRSTRPRAAGSTTAG